MTSEKCLEQINAAYEFLLLELPWPPDDDAEIEDKKQHVIDALHAYSRFVTTCRSILDQWQKQ